MKKLLYATFVITVWTGNIFASDKPQQSTKNTHQHDETRRGYCLTESFKGKNFFPINVILPKRFQDILKHLTPGLMSALIQTVFLDKTSKNYSLQRLIIALLAPYFSYLLLEQEPGNQPPFPVKSESDEGLNLSDKQNIQHAETIKFNIQEAQKNRQAQRTIAYLSTLIAAAPFVWDLLTKTQRKPNIQVSSFVKLIK